MLDGEVIIFTDDPGWHGRELVSRCQQAGYAARFVSLKDCYFELGAGVDGIVIPGCATQLPLAVFVRGVPGGSLEEIVLRLDILHVLKAAGITVFNDAKVIECTVDKARTSMALHQAKLPTPPTFVSGDAVKVKAYVARELAAGHRLVKKPLFGSQGKGLGLLCKEQDLPPLLPGEIVYLQRFIDTADNGFSDYRVMVVNGVAVAAMQRSSQHWITNRAQGASCAAAPLDAELSDLAERAAKVLAADYAGVDLLRDREGNWWLTELNGIPAWQGLQRASGIDVTAAISRAFFARAGLAAATPSLTSV